MLNPELNIPNLWLLCYNLVMKILLVPNCYYYNIYKFNKDLAILNRLTLRKPYRRGLNFF